ncbi:MAG TPA: IPT/TIG domain-containing protein [Solirubrobacteraceae bacterium]|nr:IPT/TIG domain-containing protein [Solirubrobacteraceae bacterium]
MGRSTAGRRRGRAGLVAALSAIAALALGCGDAGAVIVHLPGKTLGYQPLSGAAPTPIKPLLDGKPPSSGNSKSGKPLLYNGGPVMTSNTNYALYWDPSGAPAYPAGYEQGIDRYFEDLAHDSGGNQNTDSVLVQYYDEAGEHANYDSHFGGALIDTDPYPANGCSAAPICLTDQQLRTEIKKYVEANGLPAGLAHEYFLLTPPGVESCFEAAGHSCSAGASHAAYCAYHGYISASVGVLIYANDPYVDGIECDVGEEHPNGNPSDATIGGGLSHEHSESVTDPELNAWYDAKEEEIGDKCRTFNEATEYGEALGIAPDGAKYNQAIDGDLYYYQQEWSNEAGGCEQRSALLPIVKKAAPKKGPASGGTPVTITGANFIGPVTVEFGETPATEVTVESSASLTAVSPAGAPGSKVSITVKTASGTSAVVKKVSFKYLKK